MDELAAFDRGQLQAAERAAVEQHVAVCADCCQRLESVGEDGLIALLRTAVGLSSTALEDTRDPSPGRGDTPTPSASAVPPELSEHPRYRILGPLGAGGMGVVFKAEHRLMERTVAVKIIHKDLIERAECIERFRQEVKAAARLNHPNIVTAYDAEQAGELHFLVMEFIEGQSLDAVVRTQGPLPVALACDLARQAALGLQHAHDRGMIHRDIKPHNLLRTPAGQVKILDFGLARFLSETSGGSLTAPGVVLGTPDYVAPEQALDARQADIRADIYSLGCTLYFLLASRPPFPDGSALQKLMAHQQRAPRTLADIRPDVPAELLRVVERLMAKDPTQRYQTPAEAVTALAPFVHGDGAASFADVSGVEASKPRRRWLPASVAVAAVLVAVSLCGMLIARLFLRQTNPPSSSPTEAATPLLTPFGDCSAVFSRAVIRADCQLALVARMDNVVSLWDLTKGEEIGRLEGHTDRPLGLAFSLDGRQAATGSMDGTIRLWDLSDRQASKILDNRGTWIRGIDFWPSNRCVVSGDNHTHVLLWDAVAGQVLHDFAGHQGLLYDLKVSGDLAISASNDHTARVWDLRQRRELHCLRGHDQSVICAVLSNDHQYALTGSQDQTVRFWELATEKTRHVLRGHVATIDCVALSSDCRRALSGDQLGFIRMWDVEKGEEVRCYREPRGRTIRAVAFCPDGQRIVSVDGGGMFRFWHLP
jgi:hypothetical protein